MSSRAAFARPRCLQTYPTPDDAALLRPKCRPFRLTPSASTGIRPALYDDALLRPMCHYSIRTARCLYRPAPCFARYMSVSAKFTHCLFSASVRTLNLTASRVAKSKSRVRRPIKFYAKRSKAVRISSRRSPILRRNFTLSCLKKRLFSYKLVK